MAVVLNIATYEMRKVEITKQVETCCKKEF